jgi:hypothetical protein
MLTRIIWWQVRNRTDRFVQTLFSAMPYKWEVRPDQRLGVGRLEGIVSGADVLSAAEAFFNDKDWQPGYRLVWDNRKIRKLAITPGDAARILGKAREVGKIIGEGRSAAVISADLRVIGEHLIMMSGLDPENVRLFSSIEKAAEWLEVPVDEIENAAAPV